MVAMWTTSVITNDCLISATKETKIKQSLVISLLISTQCVKEYLGQPIFKKNKKNANVHNNNDNKLSIIRH